MDVANLPWWSCAGNGQAIYILIASTFTPFTLGVMRGTWGYVLLVAIWTFALLG